MEVFWCSLLLLLRLQAADGVKCFSRFVPSSLTCGGDVIGEIDQETCCLNPKYAFQTEDGVCNACGPPLWTSWTEWSKCTTLCGEGVRLRKQNCYGLSQSECVGGPRVEAEPCNGTCCEETGWQPWHEWSPCSVTCGVGGVKQRFRWCRRFECLHTCTGTNQETEDCPVLPCPVHGGWSLWSSWSECSGCISPGGNLTTQTRHRSCSNPAPSVTPPGDDCPGDSSQTQRCTELPNCAVDGNWGPWSALGPCSARCGEGIMTSQRSCDQPSPQYGGRLCEGQSTRTSPCRGSCPAGSYWAQWSAWSECSQTCIPDRWTIPTRTRKKTCVHPSGGGICDGPNTETGSCTHLEYCAVDGVWGRWPDQGPCSVSCGEGISISRRRCDSPYPEHGGRYCEGPSTKTSVCSNYCKVPSFWTGWSPWSECSATCKTEMGRTPMRTKRRTCINPEESGPCEGSSTFSTSCSNLKYCKVHGSWGAWSAFSSCPVTCGVGLRTSTRSCDSPAPKHGGDRCPGENSRTQMCNTYQQCPVDGVWSEWTAWGPCQDGTDPTRLIKCEKLGGSQSRQRTCLHRTPGGDRCHPRASSQSRVCYDVTGCQVKGQWEGWEPWSLCTPPCGDGSKRSRKRRCKPDFSSYSPTIGKKREAATFFGEPLADCGSPATEEEESCVNAPPC